MPGWPVIEANRCMLRPADLADLPALDAAVANPAFQQDLPLARMRREGKLSQWFERLCVDGPEPKLWSITTRSADQCIGMVTLSPEKKTGEWWLSYWLASEHWGKGIAREAVAALLSTVFSRPEYIMVTAVVGATNQRSIALLLAVGFCRATGLSTQAVVPEGHIPFTFSASATSGA